MEMAASCKCAFPIQTAIGRSALSTTLDGKAWPGRTRRRVLSIAAKGLVEDYDGYQIKLARPQKAWISTATSLRVAAESEQRGAGPYPVSEPEVKALVDFIVQHPNINLDLPTTPSAG